MKRAHSGLALLIFRSALVGVTSASTLLSLSMPTLAGWQEDQLRQQQERQQQQQQDDQRRQQQQAEYMRRQQQQQQDDQMRQERQQQRQQQQQQQQQQWDDQMRQQQQAEYMRRQREDSALQQKQQLQIPNSQPLGLHFIPMRNGKMVRISQDRYPYLYKYLGHEIISILYNTEESCSKLIGDADALPDDFTAAFTRAMTQIIDCNRPEYINLAERALRLKILSREYLD